MIYCHCRNCWRNLQGKNKGREGGREGEREGDREGEREGGREEGGLKQYFHRGYHQIGKGTVYTKLQVGQSKL